MTRFIVFEPLYSLSSFDTSITIKQIMSQNIWIAYFLGEPPQSFLRAQNRKLN